MAPDAPTSVIRSSYRARARQHHPDRADGDVAGVSMADINEAYRVLKDPGRRAVYDRSLAGAPAAGASTASSDSADRDDLVVTPRPRPNPLSPDGPARFPWRGLLVAGVIGSGLVLLNAALADPPEEEVPDGIIQIGSCIALEPNGDAREVACTGADDIVVEQLIPLDARCPGDLEPHRDRLGLGIACVVPG